jgi:flagellar biosynthetic protein FlhB
MSGERTEKASPRRKQEAREKGDVPHSRDLTSAAAMLAGTLVLGWIGPMWEARWAGSYGALLDLGQPRSWLDGQMVEKMLALRAAMMTVLWPLVAMFLACFAGAVLAGVAQGRGVQFAGEAIAPKWERMNPLTVLQQTFSSRGLTRMLKSALPVAALACFVAGKVREQTAIPVFSLTRLPSLFSSMYGLMVDAAAVLFVWSAIDYAVEWWSWEQRLRMSKQEVREEFKQTEGNPEVRRRIASIRRQLRRKALRADVSRASVVITNPTHYAVALQFSLELMEAPRVLAKGRDLLAEQIKQEARWAGVPLVENPPLARALYRQVEVGQSIPFALYAAVAAILAWLYRRDMEERLRRQQQQEAARARSQDLSTHGEEAEGTATQPASEWMREPGHSPGPDSPADTTNNNEENL